VTESNRCVLAPPFADSYDLLSGSKLLRSGFMLIVSRRHYLVCFERFAGLSCGAARCLLPRLRLATTERRRIVPRHFIRPSRLQLIVRISPNRTSQSLICETNTVGVKLLAVNKWNCVFAARIVLSECSSALLNVSARWISMFSPPAN
jgi:hypothetical protein